MLVSRDQPGDVLPSHPLFRTADLSIYRKDLQWSIRNALHPHSRTTRQWASVRKHIFFAMLDVLISVIAVVLMLRMADSLRKSSQAHGLNMQHKEEASSEEAHLLCRKTLFGHPNACTLHNAAFRDSRRWSSMRICHSIDCPEVKSILFIRIILCKLNLLESQEIIAEVLRCEYRVTWG